MPATASLPKTATRRHTALVRVTHWLTFASFVALLITGLEIIVSHPRFYWGETGNVNMQPLFVIPIPASRDTVPTAYHFVMPDQNGWSRALHFESAWVLVLTALVYGIAGIATGHFRKNLLPGRGEWSWRPHWRRIAQYLKLARGEPDEPHRYNVLQKASYAVVVFVLFPLVIWTGLSLSPGFNASFPWFVNALGGRQSARTLHFFVTIALTLFLLVHVVMVAVSGFKVRMRGMITGRGAGEEKSL